jgi:hypothetical protein
MYAVCISEFPIHFNHKNASYPETSPVSDYRLEGTTKRFQGNLSHFGRMFLRLIYILI